MTLSSPIRIGVALAAAATGALLAACDDEAPAPRPVLATLSGTISATEPPPADAEIRVALLWATNSKSWEDKSIKHFVAQDVAVTAVSWPATFQLAITELPPENALDHGAAGGQVIAYRDLNHNGKLDFTPPDADHFVDEVFAYDSDLAVWYQDPDMNPGLTPGFSTSEGSIDTPITLTERPLAASCHLLEWELSDPANGPAGVGPWGPNTGVGHMNYCPESPTQLTADGVGVELTDGDGSPPPETTELACQVFSGPPDQPAGFYEARWSPENTSAFVLATCGTPVRSCNSLRASNDTPPPAWPCPCDPARYTCTGNQ
jgi:hypothetical protein